MPTPVSNVVKLDSWGTTYCRPIVTLLAIGRFCFLLLFPLNKGNMWSTSLNPMK